MLSSSAATSDEPAAVGARYNSALHSNDSVQSTLCKYHDTVLGSGPKLATKYNSLLNHHHSGATAQLLVKQSQISHIRGAAQNSPSSIGHRDHQTRIGRTSSSEGSPVGNNPHRLCKLESQRNTIGGPGNSGSNGGNASGLERRMNSNGFDRSGMTGNNNTTTESISPWQPEVAVASQSTSRASGSTVLTSVTVSHETPPSIPPTGGPFYRQSSAFSRRSIYTTTGTGNTLLPFASPSLYAPQSHQLSLTSSPYYYTGGYPFTISGGPFMGTYPPSFQDSSQSAAEMLERFNRHVQQQHTGPSQIPPYLPHIPPYRLTPTTSPGPSIPPRPIASMDPTHRHESKSPKSELGMRAEPRGSPSKDTADGGSSTRPRSPHHHPTGLHHHLSPHHHKSPQYESGIRDPGYSRRFTRPIDIGPSSHTGSSEFKFPSTVKHEEPPHKRHKSEGRYYMPSHHHHQRPSTSIPSSTTGGGGYGGPHLPPPTGYPPSPGSYPTQPHYPPHFMKGSIIQLANGEFKRVEDLRTEDFVTSADISSDLKIDSSTVVKIEENRDRGTALLGFSVGEHRIQVLFLLYLLTMVTTSWNFKWNRIVIWLCPRLCRNFKPWTMAHIGQIVFFSFCIFLTNCQLFLSY